MQQFVLEIIEYLEIMCSEAGEEMDDFMVLARDETLKWKNLISLCPLMFNMWKTSVFGWMSLNGLIACQKKKSQNDLFADLNLMSFVKKCICAPSIKLTLYACFKRVKSTSQGYLDC